MAATSCNMEEAVKACEVGEKRFVARDIAGAIRCARRFSSSLRDLANALAAHEVHAAADVSSRVGGANWYAVLGMDKLPSANAVTHEAIKKQHRLLCLVLHSDKNCSAPADGAFKLIRQAWEVLSVRHPQGGQPQPRPEPDFWSSFATGPWLSGTGGSPQPEAAGDNSRTPPPDRSSSRRSRSWQPRYARRRGHIFCGNGGLSEFDEEDETHDESEERCPSCFGRLRHQSRAEDTASSRERTLSPSIYPESPADMEEEVPPAQEATDS